MTSAQLVQEAQRIEKEIRHLTGPSRDTQVSAFFRVLHKLRQNGTSISGHLRRVERTLEEQAAEDRFDNMPV